MPWRRQLQQLLSELTPDQAERLKDIIAGAQEAEGRLHKDKHLSFRQVELTPEDLTPAVAAIFAASFPPQVVQAMPKDQQRQLKQKIVDDLWPGLQVILALANERLKSALGGEEELG